MRNLINILAKTQAAVVAAVLVVGSFPISASAVTGPVPGTNPELGNSCGFDVVVVMDTSSSIDNGELSTMKTSLKGFVDALASTPSEFAVVSFDDSATTQTGFTTASGADTAIDGTDGSGATNWEAGLDEAASQYDPRTNSGNLVVFASDGNPTVNNGSSATSGTTDGNDLTNAITVANGIKDGSLTGGHPTRIVTVGIGNDVSQSNMEAISSADGYYSAATFGDLPATLSNIVTDLCGGTVNIHKVVKDGETESSGGAGWTFTVNGQDYVTDDTGSVSVPLSTGSYSVTEKSVNGGYTFDTASCTKGDSADGSLDSENHAVTGVSLDDQDVVSCTFTNDAVHNSATVHAQKVICDAESDLPNWGDGGPDVTASTAQDWVNQSEGACHLADWDFQWATGDTANPGDNVEDGGAGWNSFSGTAVIPTSADGANFWFREEMPSGYIPFSGSTSEPRDNVSAEMYCDTDVLNYDNYDLISGLKTGDEKYCVAFNVPTEVHQSGADVSVEKTVDNQTPNSGDSVIYTITVTNNGPEDAQNVSVSDLLPSGASYVSDDGSGDYNSGTGVWSIGSLGNGSSVSLHITATVTAEEDSEVTNTATVSSGGETGPNDPNSDNNSSSATFSVPSEGGSTDVCPNLEGDQSSVPAGYKLSNTGECVKHHSSRGGGGGGNTNGGQVLGASTCGPLLTDYLKLGWANNADQVKALQGFLNTQLGLNLPLSGFFGNDTFAAVKAFQLQYGSDVLIPWVGLPASGITGNDTPTGFVYQTTRWKINNIWCPGSEAFPATLN